MAIALVRRSFTSVALAYVRRFLFFGQFVAVGLLAVAISGAICWGLSHQYGKNIIAGDSQSAHLSAARCADLFEYHPEAKDCSSAELAHHTDEVVFYGLQLALLAPVAWLFYLGARRVMRLTPEERGGQRFWHARLGVTAFGLAALLLLSMGLANVARGTSAGTARWFSDGGVALAFCTLYAAYVTIVRRAEG